jgi:PBP1b-binding outer membrane lipoprotein LpoB
MKIALIVLMLIVVVAGCAGTTTTTDTTATTTVEPAVDTTQEGLGNAAGAESDLNPSETENISSDLDGVIDTLS